MKKYAIAFISFFDNELSISFVVGSSEASAALNFLADKAYDMVESEDLHTIKGQCFDADCMIDVVEVPQ